MLGIVEILGPDAEGHLLPAVGLKRLDVAWMHLEPQAAALLHEVELAGFFGQLAVDEVHGRRANETGDELIGRLVVERDRLVDLLDMALVHDHDPVAHGHGFDLVVRHVDHRGL